eukprot:scaffold223645_cov21-Tisochrysis_lutea.AAC.1
MLALLHPCQTTAAAHRCLKALLHPCQSAAPVGASPNCMEQQVYTTQHLLTSMLFCIRAAQQQQQPWLGEVVRTLVARGQELGVDSHPTAGPTWRAGLLGLQASMLAHIQEQSESHHAGAK